jgi:hypothetical protein
MYPTDKSPYNIENYVTEHGSGHSHPYTAVYDMLFSQIRHRPIKFAELGILDSMSMLMWRDYFPNATLFGYDNSSYFLQKCESLKIPNCFLSEMDVLNESSIEEGLSKYGKFDIILEDTTHQFEDQIRVCEIAHRHLNPGGILIIEDIFRSTDESRYGERLEKIAKYYSSIFFVKTEHLNRYSPGWDNDKLLILIRNEYM